MQQSLELLKQPIAADQYKTWISKQKARVISKPAAGAGNNNAVNLQLF